MLGVACGLDRDHYGGWIMSASKNSLTEIDARIATVRENLRQLVEQAAGLSGAADEELISNRIQEQEAELEALSKKRLAMTTASGG
jgi:hypothetical protein